MSRDLTSAIKTASQQSRISTCHLLTLYLDAQTIYWCDYSRDVVFEEHNYSHAGSLLEFDGLEETSDVVVNSCTISLSGVDTNNISLVLANLYLDRRVTIHRAFFDSNDELIPDPILIFDGRINRPSIEENPEDGTSVVSVEASNQFADFERRPGRHTSNDEQQIYYPGDKGFEYATEIDRTLTWGS